MKKFYMILVALLVAFSASNATAQALLGKQAKKASIENAKALAGLVTEKNVAQPLNFPAVPQFASAVKESGKATKSNAPRKATPLIETPPEGTVKYYKRSGGTYNARTYGNTPQEQEGVITIVFCDNNEVYIQNPVSTAYQAGTYIKGTLNGNTITVQLPQTLWAAAATYNAELAWLDITPYIEGTVTTYYTSAMKADRTNTTAVYTIDDNGVISLQGSSNTYVLAAVWDDDNMWHGGADFESVYTPTTLEDLITPPAGISPVAYYYKGKSYYSNADHNFLTTVNVVKDGNDVYIQGLATGDAGYEVLPDAWAKGTFDGTTASFPSGQYVGSDSSGDEYVISYSGNDLVFDYDAENQVFTLADDYVMEYTEPTYSGNGSLWAYFTTVKVYKGEIEQPDVVEVPEGLETEAYTWTGSTLGSDDDDNPVYTAFTKFINVGYDGNDVYVQGLCEDLPEAWVKGTINGTTATFATGQYLGFEEWYGYTFPHYFVGNDASTQNIKDVVFTFDPDAKSFVTTDYIIDNEEADKVAYYYIYTDNAWNLIQEIAGKPAAPSVVSWKLEDTSYPKIYLDIPLEDVEGNQMNPNKVFYRIFIDIERDVQQLAFTPEEYKYVTEVMYEIPYTYNDSYDIYEGGSLVYLNQGLDYAAINKLGVQVVYYGGMDMGSGAPRFAPSDVADNETEIVWAEVKPYTTDPNTGIADINSSNVDSTRYYNAAGLSSNKPFQGLNIVVKKMSDGSVKVEKVIK